MTLVKENAQILSYVNMMQELIEAHDGFIISQNRENEIIDFFSIYLLLMLFEQYILISMHWNVLYIMYCIMFYYE